MIKTIVILQSGPSAYTPALALKALARAFNSFGFETITLHMEDPNIRAAIKKVVSSNNVFFFLSHNLAGWDFSINENKRDVFLFDEIDRWLVSFIDTPLNKFDRIKAPGKKKILMFLDEAFTGMVENVAKNELHTFPIKDFIIEDDDLNKKNSAIPFQERKYDVLFVGRVGANTKFMRKDNNFIKQICLNRAVKYAFHPQSRQIYDTYNEFLQKGVFRRWQNFFLPKPSFSENHLYFLWGVSNLVRAKRRQHVIDELAKLPSNIKVLIITDSPEKLEGRFNNTTEFLPFQNWADIVNIMGESKIVINVLPFRIMGAHERLFTGMARGAAIASDSNAYLDSLFHGGRDIIYYNFVRDNLKDTLVSSLNNLDDLGKIASRGREKTLKEASPSIRARQIIDMVNTCQGEGKTAP